MGLSDLRQLAVINEVSYDALSGGTVAVDFHNWIYRYLTILARFTDESVYTTSDGTEVANLLGIVKGLPKFHENGLAPVFVFDGAVLELKEDEMQRRREQRADAAERLAEAEAAGDEARARSLRAQTQRLTPTILETSRELLDILDVPVVDAPDEAESQAAHMARTGVVDYVGTEDYDALLFGAPLTLRNLTGSGDPECMELDATLDHLGVTLPQLVDIAILCGTDYNDGVHGIGPKTALKRIAAGESLEEIAASRDADIPNLEAIRSIYLDASVDDSVTVDWEWTPDLDAARTFLVDEWELPADRVATAFDRLDTVAE